MLALSLLCLALVALLAYREWGAARDRRETSAVIVAERLAAAEERRELYQRIQAPEIAVHDAALEARRERPYVRREPVGADDDAAFNRRAAERQALRDAEVSGG